MDITKISPARTSNSSQKGFTLIEVMIVLSILGALVAVGLPRIRGQQNNFKTITRQLSTLTREVRNQARVKRMTYRLAFRMGEKEQNAYWVENAPANYVIPSEATLERLRDVDEDKRPPSPFQKVTKFFKEDKELPGGFFIGSIETPSMKEPQKEGIAYVYFTAEGLVEKAIIQITNRKEVTWSLVINPITGHADLVEKSIAMKDLRFD